MGGLDAGFRLFCCGQLMKERNIVDTQPAVTRRPVSPALLKFCSLWAAAVLVVYFKVHPLPLEAFQAMPSFGRAWPAAMARHLLVFFEAVFLGGLAVLIGRGILKRLVQPTEQTPREEACLSLGLGVGLLGSLYLLMALAHMVSPAFVFCMLSLLTIGGLAANRDLAAACRACPGLAEKTPRIPTPNRIPAIFILVALTLGGLQALSAETFYDSLVYHLALPNLYKLSGGYVATPECLYSGIPMLVEMFYAWSLYLNANSLAPLLSWMTFAASACLMIEIGSRVQSEVAGQWAAAIFLTAPFIIDASHRSGVEGASALWLLCAVDVLVRIGDYRTTDFRPFVLVGIFVGCAMGAKYTNWPLLLVAGVILRAMGVPYRTVARFAAAAAAVMAPWAIKNLVFYGNPIFPFADDLIGWSARLPVDWRALHADARGRDWAQVFSSTKEAAGLVIHPWRLTMDGRNDHDTLGPAFLMLLPCLAYWKNSSRQHKLIVFAAFGTWLFWWPFSSLPRFFIPGLSLVALACSVLLAEPPGPPRLVVLALSLAASFNLVDSAIFALRFGSGKELLGQETTDQNLLRGRSTYPAPNYGALKWLNENSSPTAKVLVVGDGRTFYLQRLFVPNSLIDRPVFFEHLAASRSAAELSAALRARGLTHIVVNMSLLARTRPPRSGDPAAMVGTLREFLFHYADLAFEERDLPTERWNLVYALRAMPSERPLRGSDIFLTWFNRDSRPLIQ